MAEGSDVEDGEDGEEGDGGSSFYDCEFCRGEEPVAVSSFLLLKGGFFFRRR